jgi:hypothetical protein
MTSQSHRRSDGEGVGAVAERTGGVQASNSEVPAQKSTCLVESEHVEG